MTVETGTETDYLAVFMEGKKVGHSVHTRSVEGGQVTTSEQVSITISRIGIPITIEMTETSVETTAGKPLRFESVQNLGAMVMKVEGVVKDDGVVDVNSSSMGTRQKSTMQWPEGALMAEGLRLLTLKKGLKPGVEYSASLFSAGVMQAMTAKVSIKDKKEVDLLGRVLKLTEVSTTMEMPGAGQITSSSYVDDEMRTLKSVVPIAGMVVEMVDCPKEFALGKNDVLEMIDKMFVKSPEPIENVHATTAITYTINPGKTADFTIPSTDNQKATPTPDGKVVLVIRPVAAPAGGTFPYKGSDPALIEATKSTRFLQSENKEIVALARKAVGDAKDTAEAAGRIEAFVAEYIEDKSLSVGYASAAEVVESRQGDCSEFAVLTAAMCRAVGDSLASRGRRRVRRGVRRHAGLRRPRLDASLYWGQVDRPGCRIQKRRSRRLRRRPYRPGRRQRRTRRLLQHGQRPGPVQNREGRGPESQVGPIGPIGPIGPSPNCTSTAMNSTVLLPLKLLSWAS